MRKNGIDELLDQATCLSLKRAAKLEDVSEETLKEHIKLGIHPPPFQLRPGGPKKFQLSVIKAHIEKRKRARYTPPTPRGALKRGKTLHRQRGGV